VGCGGITMTNLLVLPMALPLIIAVLLVFIPSFIYMQRWMTMIVLVTNTIISFLLLQHVVHQGIISIDFGGWEAPFGISFVGDSFALLLVLITNIVGAICVLYAMATIGLDREKLYFYSFVLFLIAGVNGSFLTGDLFNLFVTFEVMLLASYALITLGGTKKQLQE